MSTCHTTDSGTIGHTDACRDECYDSPNDQAENEE